MKYYGKQTGVYCLNRGWRFIKQDFSVFPPTNQHDDMYGFAKAGGCRGPAAASFDDRNWEEIELPHDWVTKEPFIAEGSPSQGYKRRGIGWYRMRFELPPEDKDKQLLLDFEGMSCNAQIYVNGTLLKHNFSGYNSFVVDMTDMANFGVVPNVLAIRIDASAWEGWWYEGAGIYRNVWLVKKAPLHIAYRGIYVKPEKLSEDIWQLDAEVELENTFAQDECGRIRVFLEEENGNCVACGQTEKIVQGFERESCHFRMTIQQPKLWEPQEPNLYMFKVVVEQDGEEIEQQSIVTGFRTIDLHADTGFYLNGKPVKLKGFCNHQDHAGIGVAVPYSIKEYRVRLLKELGANAYRLSHNPDPEIIDICDRLGLMVMQENRTYSSTKENLEELEGVIKDARNHPSVIMYSLFNEEPLQGTLIGKRMAARMKHVVKKLDDTRPVLGAFNCGYFEEDGAVTALDAVGINYKPQVYDEFHKKFPNIPLIGSETTSAFMVRDEYEDNEEKHLINCFDDHAAFWGNKVRDAWKAVYERAFVAGAFVWTGFDYRGEPTPYVWPSVSTFFGTYDSCGIEKDTCYWYKAFWKKEPVLHIVSPWKNGRKQSGDMVRVMVISNCDEVEVFADNKSYGRKQIHIYEQNEWFVPFAGGELKAEGYKNGIKVTEDVMCAAGEPSRLLFLVSQDKLNDTGTDAVAVTVVLADKKGNPVDAEGVLTFKVEGGRYLGGGNGNPNSHESDIALTRHMFHGKAQGIIKLDVNAKMLKITASYESIITEKIVLPVSHEEFFPYIKPVKDMVVDGWKFYAQLFDEMPDPNLRVEINDMNSFDSVHFNGTPQAELSGQIGKYGLYRTVFDMVPSENGNYLYFEDIDGLVWIYVDGILLKERTDSFGGMLTVNLPKGMQGKHVISVVVKNDNKEWPEAGIKSPVMYKS